MAKHFKMSSFCLCLAIFLFILTHYVSPVSACMQSQIYSYDSAVIGNGSCPDRTADLSVCHFAFESAVTQKCRILLLTNNISGVSIQIDRLEATNSFSYIYAEGHDCDSTSDCQVEYHLFEITNDVQSCYSTLDKTSTIWYIRFVNIPLFLHAFPENESNPNPFCSNDVLHNETNFELSDQCNVSVHRSIDFGSVWKRKIDGIEKRLTEYRYVRLWHTLYDGCTCGLGYREWLFKCPNLGIQRNLIIYHSESEALNFENSAIAFLEPHAFTGFHWVIRLLLLRNHIRELPSNIFADLTSLKILNLHDNLLKTIPTRGFSTLRNLTILDLSDNKITNLPNDTFSNLDLLSELRLQNNRLVDFLPNKYELKSLTKLNVSSNRLDGLVTCQSDSLQRCSITNSDFPNLYFLKELFVSDNDFDWLPLYLYSRLTEELDLTKNKIVSLASGLNNLNRLKVLSLTSNQVSRITDDVFVDLTRLIECYLNDNQIRYVEENSFRFNIKLRFLDLSYNKIKELSTLTHNSLRKLVKLNLQFNLLTEINKINFETLSLINVLYMSSNLLNDIPDFAFTKLHHLQIIQVSKNKLKTLTNHTWSGLQNLITLDLRQNQLETIHSHAFASLISLTTLNLAHNQLTTFPVGLFHPLINLKTLYLEYNRLNTVVNTSFVTLTKLITLYLNANNIAHIQPGIFDNLTDLSSLIISDNFIQSIEQNIVSAAFKTKMYSLQLNSNKIQRVSTDFLGGLNELRYLELKNNMLVTLPADVFNKITTNTNIHLSFNRLRSLPHFPFPNATKRVTFEFNEFTTLSLGTF